VLHGLGLVRHYYNDETRRRKVTVDDRDWLAQSFEENRTHLRAVAEGGLVVTHSLSKTSPEDCGTAAADFFRLEDGKIFEHWDVLQPVPEQPVPETAANDHPMF
jgi:predicted SnoaL-like aldol condensation-catalyzing enzyme